MASFSPLFPGFGRNNKNNQNAKNGPNKSPTNEMGQIRSNLNKSITNSVQDALKKKWGDLGAIVSSLFKPFARVEKDVADAVEKAVEQQIQQSHQAMEQLGTVGREQVPPRRPEYRAGTVKENDVDEFAEDRPILDGPYMVQGSSNVYSIAFEFKDGTSVGNILVTFLGSGPNGARVGEGPMYRYFGLSHQKFEEFRDAASKGHWVWTDLRLPGSMIGHQVNFELATASPSGYVPRAIATKRGQQGIYYTQRSHQGQRSNLPERKIGRQPASNILGWQNRHNLHFRAGGR